MKTNKKTSTGVTRYTEWIIRWRWPVLLVTLLAALAAGSGGRFIEFKNDYRVFFSKENPQLEAYESLRNIYTKDDNILFVLATRDESTVYENTVMEATQWLTAETWKLPYSTRVDSLANYQHSYAEEDDLIVEDLIQNPEQMSEADLNRIREIAMAEPLLYNRLVGDKDHVAGVNVTLTLPLEDPNEVVYAAQAARELRDRFEERYPGVEIYLTGMVMLNNSFAESAMGDMASIIPLMYLGIFITLGILLRNFSAVVGTIGVVILATLTGMGLMGWLGFPMTPPVSTAPTMIMTLAVADSIHLLVTMLHEMRRGRDKRAAIIEAVRTNFGPIFLTSLTTVIGFLSMNFSDAPPFRVLGNVVAIGVVGAWIYSIAFLPALMAILPVKVRQRAESSESMFDALSGFIIRRQKLALWGSAAAIVGMALFTMRIELNDQWVEYFDESMEFRQDSDFSMESLSGIYTLEYSIEAGESGGISNPEYLQKLDEFASWYRQQNGVKQVVVLSDVMKRLNKNLHNDNEEWYRIPDDRNLAAQYLLLYEMSLPYGLDLNNQINVDKSASRFVVSVENISTREVRELSEAAEAWMDTNAPDGMQAIAASPTVMFAHISERNIKSMSAGTGIAVLLIALALGIALKSSRFGILSLLPNILPAAFGFGIWGLVVGEMGLSLSIVTGMTLGIVVDDTVHFLSKYLRARREHNYSAEEAVRFAFQRVGKALVVTTIILVVGFSILSLSTFRLNSWMGQLTAIVIASALLIDLIFLPALLLKIDGKKDEAREITMDVVPDAVGAAN